MKLCIECDKPLINSASIFCSRKCSFINRYRQEKINAMIALDNGTLSDINARRWFRKVTQPVCSICGLDSWLGKSIPLVVDHIDGNHNNNRKDNLRMICCNCDAQLPTYKGANKGNGRKARLDKLRQSR
jgi:hypothetical protein